MATERAITLKHRPWYEGRPGEQVKVLVDGVHVAYLDTTLVGELAFYAAAPPDADRPADIFDKRVSLAKGIRPRIKLSNFTQPPRKRVVFDNLTEDEVNRLQDFIRGASEVPVERMTVEEVSA